MTYDVFLSYSTRDRAHVEAIARALRKESLDVFLDCWHLAPGKPWPQELERILASCRAVAVCLGPGEMGSWQQREVSLAHTRQADDANFPVIPVLLPQSEPVLGFLRLNTWVDLRERVDDHTQLSILANAIRGQAPAPELIDQVRATLATVCPFRGLLYFREEDKDFFFGREHAIADLERAVQRANFVSLVGASGSGKSSVVRAGLIPKLRAARARAWEIVTLVPGKRPLHAICAALMPLLEPSLSESDFMIEVNKQVRALECGDLTLRDIVERVLAKQSGTERLLIFIDQWEELYTETSEASLRQRFIDELLHATAENTAIHVVLTIRADFFDRALEYRALTDRCSQVNLGPMNREELQLAILEPAKNVNLGFAPGLVTLILDDVGGEPGNLPLLEFVLKQLWEQRRGGELSYEAYEAMGRLRGAITAKAEALFETSSALEQEALQRLFMRLVRPGETADARYATRRRAVLSDIGEPSLPLLRKLANKEHRLLVTGKDAGSGEDTVEVSHEALIRNWGRLDGWLKADHEFLLWRERFRVALADWEAKAQDERLLLRDPLLSEAEGWLARRGDQINEKDRDFCQASQNYRIREQDAERERQKRELDLVEQHARLEREKQEAELAHQQRQNRLLSEQNERMGNLNSVANFLHRSSTIEEIKVVIHQRTSGLLGASTGAIYRCDEEISLFEVFQAWGEEPAIPANFHANACWAVKNSSGFHVVEEVELGTALFCGHVMDFMTPCPYLCVLGIGRGDSRFILYLQLSEPTESGSREEQRLWIDAKRELATALVQHVAVAIENLEFKEALQLSALTDPLTGLYSRRFLQEELSKKIAIMQRDQSTLGLIAVDIDNFKAINDRYSHEAGDYLLRELAAFLQTKLRESDYVCRTGGEEFMLILTHPADQPGVMMVAEKIREGAKALVVSFQGHPIQFTLSLGVTVVSGKDMESHKRSRQFAKENADHLTRVADQALYQAKQEGHDGVVFRDARL
jgi:diguanylate cyclase (GGDEF)-like protein